MLARQHLPLVVLLAFACFATLTADDSKPPATEDAPVSYYKQVLPIFQAHCQGCHQPAKANGKYVMSSVEALVKGGESGEKAIAPGAPDESYLVEQITPEDGEALMPPDKPPLADSEIALIRRWIEQGAKDDTPENARRKYDMDHPPVYTRAPVISSLDFAPDGSQLAIAGFHEVLLVKADGSERIARLVGMAERIESVRFSPDGARLAVAGGLPCRTGEIQVWDVAKRKLLLSQPVTFDTVYGGSWSPDGKLIAFGAADNGVRAIDAETGEQVVAMAAHEDWVRGTVFSADGKSIFSASRDMTVKMTDVETQRFVGNATTHTPGVLKGGQQAIERHPQRAEILVGGADGVAKLFKMDVQAAPAGGGNPNQIRAYEAMRGRVFDVRFSPDGVRAFAGSSLDGKGQVRAYETDSDKVLWTLDVPEAAVYALACSPDGATLAAAGSDGQIRLIDTASGQLRNAFLPVDVSASSEAAAGWVPGADSAPQPATPGAASQALPVAKLAAEPSSIRIAKPMEYAQVLLTATLADGARLDATRLAAWRVEGDVGQVSTDGRFTPAKGGAGKVVAEFSGQRVEIPVEVAGLEGSYVPDFIRDVNPILSRLGCNQGTCHGAAKGRSGFKLSLRGYDALFDIRALTDDLASRRISTASPDDSLILLKATGVAPHQGGKLIAPGSPYYNILRRWIAYGATLDLSTPRVAKIEVQPQDPIVQSGGQSQQMRVIATYADGTVRDATREAFIESGNTEVATADRMGVLSAIRRGEASVLARYEGAYAATTLTVMGDRSGFVWQQPETWGKIDELVAAKWQRMKILPSELCGDAEFIRRVYLDLTGLPPTAEDVRAFLADQRDLRTKRNELIDRLIGSDDFVEYWTNKWADLLQVNRKFLGTEGAAAFRQWIRNEVAANTPYNQFAAKILTATGSNKDNPAASYYKVLREPLVTMENTTHLFLGVRFNCNKCHDHPFERWTQDQYYQTAAYFARFELKPDPAAGDQKIGGSAVEGAQPLYEIVADKSQGDVVHDRTSAVTPPQFPYLCKFEAPAEATRRQELSGWLTSPDNPYFARSYVNRLWGYLLGVGLIEPLDDIRAGNPPSNPELLDYLTQEFIAHGFDARHTLREICQSRTYQLSIATNAWNEDDKINFSHGTVRRLPAEVLYDAIYRATGAVTRIPGVPPGTRAAALPDVGVNLPDGFLSNLGRPVRESACECERSSGLQLGPVMALVSGPTVDSAISDPANALAKLSASEMDDGRLVDEIFLRLLNRPATPKEIEGALAMLRTLPEEHQQLTARLQKVEEEFAPALATQEQRRQAAMAKAKGELESHEKEIAAREADLDRQHAERLAMAEAALKEHEARVPDLLAAWEQQVKQPTAWTALDPIELTSTNEAKLEKQPDLSVVAGGANGKTTYKFVARTDLANVTGVRLEALADERFPMKGPGRSGSGNFVLTEFRVEWAPEGEPDKKSPVVLQNAQADFSQGGYDVATAIDGKKAPTDNGWAVHPQAGQSHTAVFETKDNAGSGPGLFTVWLDQEFQDNQHTLGRFRISVTTVPRPVTLQGLPQSITDLLAVAADQRTDAQKAELLKFYRSQDSELKSREQAVAAAKQPRPIDPKLQQLRDALAEASKPVPIDPKLAGLRADAALSTKQLEQSRLTFVQDLAWALINSPAFLFNR
jgi:WD40 repeat protein/mono/diheme cytochrome c family protein